MYLFVSFFCFCLTFLSVECPHQGKFLLRHRDNLSLSLSLGHFVKHTTDRINKLTKFFELIQNCRIFAVPIWNLNKILSTLSIWTLIIEWADDRTLTSLTFVVVILKLLWFYMFIYLFFLLNVLTKWNSYCVIETTFLFLFLWAGLYIFENLTAFTPCINMGSISTYIIWVLKVPILPLH